MAFVAFDTFAEVSLLDFFPVSFSKVPLLSQADVLYQTLITFQACVGSRWARHYLDAFLAEPWRGLLRIGVEDDSVNVVFRSLLWLSCLEYAVGTACLSH